MANVIEYIFMCLFAIFISSLVKCYSCFLPVFKDKLYIFLLLSFENALNILDPNSLSHTRFKIIFSQSIACLFTFLTAVYQEQKILNTDEV